MPSLKIQEVYDNINSIMTGKQVMAMTTAEQIDRRHQEDLQRLRGFRLLDDDFLTKCFEGDPARHHGKGSASVSGRALHFDDR